jgi:hypothetical protein
VLLAGRNGEVGSVWMCLGCQLRVVLGHEIALQCAVWLDKECVVDVHLILLQVLIHINEIFPLHMWVHITTIQLKIGEAVLLHEPPKVFELVFYLVLYGEHARVLITVVVCIVVGAGVILDRRVGWLGMGMGMGMGIWMAVKDGRLGLVEQAVLGGVVEVDMKHGGLHAQLFKSQGNIEH